MKTLSHKQQIKVAGFKFAQRIEVVTLMGNYIDSTRKGYHESRQTWEEVKTRDLKNGGSLVWAYQSPAILTDNYPGKAEAMEKARKEMEAAIEIVNGEVVMIEGHEYVVKVIGERYSDPVHFIPVSKT